MNIYIYIYTSVHFYFYIMRMKILPCLAKIKCTLCNNNVGTPLACESKSASLSKSSAGRDYCGMNIRCG